MRLVLALALILGGMTPAYGATLVADLGNGYVVTITDAQCTSKKVLEQIKAEFHKYFYEGSVRESKTGTVTRLCWALQGGDTIIAVDETGDRGTIPASMFASQLEPKHKRM